MDWLMLIRISFTIAICAWMFSALFLQIAKQMSIDPDTLGMRVARWIFHEFKPFFRAMEFIRFGLHCLDLSPILWLHALVLAVDLWNYHRLKDVDDDDDRWKRRKAKVAEKVQIVSGRLAVIPA